MRLNPEGLQLVLVLLKRLIRMRLQMLQFSQFLMISLISPYRCLVGTGENYLNRVNAWRFKTKLQTTLK
jgi:hypothetical protein